jgi:hypothetical protein
MKPLKSLTKVSVLSLSISIFAGNAFAEAGLGNIDAAVSPASTVPEILSKTCPSVEFLNGKIKNLYGLIYQGLPWYYANEIQPPEKFDTFLGVNIPTRNNTHQSHISCVYFTSSKNSQQSIAYMNSGDYYYPNFIFKGTIGPWTNAICNASKSSACVFQQDANQ